MTSQKTWTVEDIRALGVRTDLPTAFSIVGIGKTAGWELLHKGELPFPALRLGRKFVVPTAPLLELLHLGESQAA